MHWVAEDGTILWANRAELEMLGYELTSSSGSTSRSSTPTSR